MFTTSIYVKHVNYLLKWTCSSRADDDFSGPMDTNVKLRYNGEITWDAPAITKSSCVVDVSYFPFDSQECNLTFGSWTYNGNQVRSTTKIQIRKFFLELYVWTGF